jgi:hypothetical protein
MTIHNTLVILALRLLSRVASSHRNFIDTVIIALLNCFCSEVRLASARLPKKSKI